MTERDASLHRAADALDRAIAPGPDDHDHPAYELIEALVDDRLGAVDREVVQAHLELCRVCAEDAADLAAMRAVMQPAVTPATAAPSRRRLMVIAASLAAMLVMTVWFSERGEPEGVAPLPPMAEAPPERPAAPASALTPAEQALVARATERGRLEVPAAIASLAGTVGTLLGDGRERAPLVPATPVGTVVLSPRPSFAWSPMPGARAYSVAVFDHAFEPVARSGRLTTTTWTPEQDLPAGQALAWQVTAHLATGDVNGPAPPQPEARFRVVDAATAATVMDQLSRLSAEPLALGILLAQAGLYDEATQALERAAAAADTRADATTILADLRRLRR